MRQKVEWAVKAGSIEKMLSKTQEVEQRLANLMTLISMKAQTPILEGLDRIEQMVSTLVIALPASTPAAPATPSIVVAAGNTIPYSGSWSTARRTLVSKPWTLAERWVPWGLRGSLVTTKKGPNYRYEINFSVSLPLARILGGYALTGCLSLDSMPLFGTAMTFRHPSYFAVARVVDDCHPFMVACLRGDMEMVRFMLRSGEGRPTDVTAGGWTPMGCAVASGEVEVIAELLDCGVDVNAVIDHSNMDNALIHSSERKDLDTVRILLQRGALTDHVDRIGYEAGTLCWNRGDDLTRHSSIDIFNLLAESSHFEMDDNPSYCCSTLCVAAMHAIGAQIDALIRLGASVHLDEDIGAAAIHLAVWSGNYSTYSALASYYDEDAFRNDTKLASELLLNTIYGRLRRLDGTLSLEYRGFRPSPEHDKVMIDMFQRGVGPRTRLHAADSIVDWTPPGIHDEEFEADKLAAVLGPATEAWYLSLLRRCGLLAHGDYQRLRELAEAGHVAHGFVYDIAEESGEVNYDVRGECGETDDAPNLGQETIYPDIGGVDRRSSLGEADEANQFWDAEELL